VQIGVADGGLDHVGRIGGIVQYRYVKFVRAKLASERDAHIDREFDLHVRIARLELRE
jgi:hypothetical protein